MQESNDTLTSSPHRLRPYEEHEEVMPDRHEPNRQEAEQQRFYQRRQLYLLVFFLGTILAVFGWLIEIKGLDEVSVKFARLTVLALIGHILQVLGAFGFLITPDSIEEDIRR